MKNESTRREKHTLFYILNIIFLALNTALLTAVYWIRKTFTVSLTAIVYSIFGNTQGNGRGTIEPAVLFCLPFIALALFFGAGFIVFNVFLSKKLTSAATFSKIFAIERGVMIFLLVFFFVFNLVYIDTKFGVIDFFKTRNQKTDFYENYYANPDNVSISLKSDKKRNLVYIYLESIESTLASAEEGGGVTGVNYIPNLTKLANENISFSDGDKLGGAMQLDGTGWTMAAMFSNATGVPWAFPIGGNDFGEVDYEFASGITALGDILESEGYSQEFLCGSDVRFAGTDKFFRSHGNYKLFDYYTAIERGYIAEDYYVWWGFDDYILYDIAKDELNELASGDKPFNFTMATIDTHPVGGYVCPHCPDTYGTNYYANVFACADKQIYDFVQWIQAQPFYENTTIIITGDHLRMDTVIVGDAPEGKRHPYNCFINTVYTEKESLNLKNRVFTSLDMFPTALSALGYEISDDRLGLGVDLFSSRSTLSEALSFDTLNEQLAKKSDFYIETFAPEFLKDNGKKESLVLPDDKRKQYLASTATPS